MLLISEVGHHVNNCRNTPVCFKCGQAAGHHPDSYPNPIKYANCGKTKPEGRMPSHHSK